MKEREKIYKPGSVSGTKDQRMAIPLRRLLLNASCDQPR